MPVEPTLLKAILDAYTENAERIRRFQDQLLVTLNGSQALAPHIHSIKARLKDLDHLRDKLERKFDQCEANGTPFEISPDNLLVRINDLTGVRVLHLYTRQIAHIDIALKQLFADEQYELIEGPSARTWDDESRDFFNACGIETIYSPTMYTSVHYVIGSNSRTMVTCEIQVRTLMEEVWGEVDHAMNYPEPSAVLAVREQLRVLARVASSGTRLVDSIFLTRDDAQGA